VKGRDEDETYSVEVVPRRTEHVRLASLVRETSEEPLEGVGLALLVRIRRLLLFVRLVGSIRGVVGTGGEALGGEEQVLDDLHRERVVEEGTLELKASLLSGIEEVGSGERVVLGEVGGGDGGGGSAVEGAEKAGGGGTEPDVRVEEVAPNGAPEREARLVVGRDEVREGLVDMRERLDGLVGKLPFGFEFRRRLPALELRLLELLLAVNEDVEKDVDDGRS
jgi:hypothetical protein